MKKLGFFMSIFMSAHEISNLMSLPHWLKYGEKYTKGLWQDTLREIASLNLDDDSQWYDFERMCEMVYDVMGKDNVKYATAIYEQDRFWTKKWQITVKDNVRNYIVTWKQYVRQNRYDSWK